MVCSPIALFVYNRPWHTEMTVQALQKNSLASASDLIIFSDGPKTEAASESVKQVRKYLKTIAGFKSVTIHESAQNIGLAKAIIDGVEKVLSKYDSIIVLEDDLITSPYFLSFMNDALCVYERQDNVVCINAYMYPVGVELPETFFLRGADCQGWATWRRGWKLFNHDGRSLLRELQQRNLIYDFNYNNSYSFSRILDHQQKGLVNSWAIRWYASAFLKDKLTLYPKKSLIKNIGFDNSGSNSSDWDKKRYETELPPGPIRVVEMRAEEDAAARSILAGYFRRTRKPLFRKVKDKLVSLLKSTHL